jgi:hypothetical protein
MFITREEVLKGREVEYPLTPEMEVNLTLLLAKSNTLRSICGIPFILNSGYRPGHYNTDAGGAKNSAHLTCEAIDVRDYSRKLTYWCLGHQDVLEELGLWMEAPEHTPNWVHLQIRAAKHRVFQPSAEA